MQFHRIIFLALSLSLLMPLWAQYEIEVAFPNLNFSRPIDIQNAGDGSDRLFVAQQSGIIAVFQNDSNATDTTHFLDISNIVDDSANEEGLLGLAFHPDYVNNGYFFVNYTSNQTDSTHISRFSVSASDPDVADPESELRIIAIHKPYSNHNAGQIAFGPEDGYLYIGTGDGGLGGDPLNAGQRMNTLLGKMLRIDVNNATAQIPYTIPADNPFVSDTTALDEIYAFGIRNPWRFSFDEDTGWLWLADVGQGDWEEIDIIESGKNYGWRCFEGNHTFNSNNCGGIEHTPPVWEYSHSLGLSVTGGYVYRGSTVPDLVGKYIYADYVFGTIWSLEYDGVNPTVNTQVDDTNLSIASFGQDEARELYIAAFDGRIHRFVPTNPTDTGNTEETIPDRFELLQNFPNPFNPVTRIPFQLSEPAHVEITIFDHLGREVLTLVDDMLGAGEHRRDWPGIDRNGNIQAAGIYFYRMKANGNVVGTRQLVFLK